MLFLFFFGRGRTRTLYVAIQVYNSRLVLQISYERFKLLCNKVKRIQNDETKVRFVVFNKSLNAHVKNLLTFPL